MALSYKSRRRWSLFILVIGLPLYVVIAVNLVDLLLGIAWVFPLKFVFQGIGQSNPDNDQDKK